MREAIKTRRSLGRFKRISADDQLILDCLEAARGAPPPNNSQPWKHTVIRNRQTVEKFSEIHDGGSYMTDTSIVVIFLADPRTSPNCYHGDVAVAVQNFLLAALASSRSMLNRSSKRGI